MINYQYFPKNHVLPVPDGLRYLLDQRSISCRPRQSSPARRACLRHHRKPAKCPRQLPVPQRHPK